MKINLLDVNEYIRVHELKEVTNSVYFHLGNSPTEDGLFSYELFGPIGSEDREKNFAYIDLKRKFLHPVCYRIITSINRKLIDLINGKKYFTIDPTGNIIEDNENGQNGLQWLYDNWEKIKWKGTDSYKRDDKIQVITKLPKDVVFVDKWLVVPCSLRDFNPNSKSGEIDDVDKINDYYSKLIRYCQSISNDDGMSFSFISNNNNYLIQELLFEIYTYCTSQLAKKNGMIHQNLIGKTVTYATRSVISCPRINSNKWNELQIPFGYIGCPLSQVAILFTPFFVNYIENWIEDNLDTLSNIDIGNGQTVYIDNIKEQFDETHIKKMIESYWKNHDGRFDPLTVEDKEGNQYKIKIYEKELGRDFALIDLLYIAAVDICENKHVYITRYPIETYLSVVPAKIKILTTTKTTKMSLGNRFFEEYPTIYEDYPKGKDKNDNSWFIDTVRFCSVYTKAMGADFDGDTISLRGVFTQEANQEAERLINSKTFILNGEGKIARPVSNECVQALFSLTR